METHLKVVGRNLLTNYNSIFDMGKLKELKDKILDLAKQYEGEDNLGILTELDIDYKSSVDIKHDRYSRDGEDKEPKVSETECWSISLCYLPNPKSYNRVRVQTGSAKTLNKAYLILQEYLKLEVIKRNIGRRISEGTISEDRIAEKPRDIFKELAVAIRDENYELASKLRDKIDADFGKKE